MGSRRVVVTGLGAISAIGRNASEFWQSLSEGRPGIAPIEAIDSTGFRFQNGAEVHGYVQRAAAQTAARPAKPGV